MASPCTSVRCCISLEGTQRSPIFHRPLRTASRTSWGVSLSVCLPQGHRIPCELEDVFQVPESSLCSKKGKQAQRMMDSEWGQKPHLRPQVSSSRPLRPLPALTLETVLGMPAGVRHGRASSVPTLRVPAPGLLPGHPLLSGPRAWCGAGPPGELEGSAAPG